MTNASDTTTVKGSETKLFSQAFDFIKQYLKNIRDGRYR